MNSLKRAGLGAGMDVVSLKSEGTTGYARWRINPPHTNA